MKKKRAFMNLPELRLALMIMLLAFASLIDGRATHAQSMAVANDIASIRNGQAIQEIKIEDLEKSIERLEKHLEYDDVVINDLKDDQHTWKGIVVGIGSVIAILELLQALGFARGKYNDKKVG